MQQNPVLNKTQSDFIAWAWNAGERDKANKLSARQTAELMPLLGTAEGADWAENGDGVMKKFWKANAGGGATFRRRFLLPHFQIKGHYSSKQQNKNEVTEKAARKRKRKSK